MIKYTLMPRLDASELRTNVLRPMCLEVARNRGSRFVCAKAHARSPRARIFVNGRLAHVLDAVGFGLCITVPPVGCLWEAVKLGHQSLIGGFEGGFCRSNSRLQVCDPLHVRSGRRIICGHFRSNRAFVLQSSGDLLSEASAILSFMLVKATLLKFAKLCVLKFLAFRFFLRCFCIDECAVCTVQLRHRRRNFNEVVVVSVAGVRAGCLSSVPGGLGNQQITGSLVLGPFYADGNFLTNLRNFDSSLRLGLGLVAFRLFGGGSLLSLLKLRGNFLWSATLL